jgi:hypothetical protein
MGVSPFMARCSRWSRLQRLMAIAALMSIAAASPCRGATRYVDGLIGVASCSTYDPTSRTCSGGNATAYASPAGAAAVVQPGDEVVIRAGSYSGQVRPVISGSAAAPIVYRSAAGESVTLTSSSSPATIVLDHVSYITIEGLTVENSRWLEALGAHHNLIRNNRFLHTPSTGTTGNVRFISSDYNRIIGNVLDDGNDNLLLIDSDHNLVEGNTITEGGHSVFSIRCANFNVIRRNFFANSQQKIGEIYDCGTDTTAVPNAFDATKHNVIEENTFADATTYYSTSGGNGIQYAGQDGIIRRNVFYHNNVGIGMQVYSDEALYNNSNRVYHNVFYDNDCAGLSVRGNSLDNRYINNILYKNKGVSGDCFGVGPAQVLYRTPITEFYFTHNNILNGVAGEAVVQEEFGTGHTLAGFEADYPTLFSDNREVSPLFRDEVTFDFRLQVGSPMVDAGVFLTKTAATGTGNTLTVEDARYFCDGYGIEGLAGDVIQLEGQHVTATIVAIDYASRVLTLDRALTWSAGQGVSLVYAGLAPDIGAFEVGASPGATLFYLLTPCRVLDTRVSAGEDAAAPVLAANTRRVFTVTGKCGVPTDASAIAANLTVVGATATGDLRVIGGHLPSTTTSALSIPLTRARANNGIVQLATNGSGTIAAINASSGTVHFVLDVSGYFR